MRAAMLAGLVACGAAAAPRHLVVITGSADEAKAKTQLDAAKARVELIGQLSLEPKLVRSADVKGLKPGFVIVVAGLCEAGGVDAAVAIAKLIDSAAYVRALPESPPETIAAMRCPARHGGSSGPELVTTKTGDQFTSIATFDRGLDASGAFRDWTALVMIRDASGALVAETWLSRQEAEQLGHAHDCETTTVKRGKFVLRDCDFDQGCPVTGKRDLELAVSVVDGKVQVSPRVTAERRPPCRGE